MSDERQALTVSEAAEALGVSENAIRQRIARGTLERAPEDDGPVRVLVRASSSAPSAGPADSDIAARLARAEAEAEAARAMAQREREAFEHERARFLQSEAERAGDGVRLDETMAELAKARAERDAARDESERARAALLALSWGLRAGEDAPPLLEDNPPSRWRLPWFRRDKD